MSLITDNLTAEGKQLKAQMEELAKLEVAIGYQQGQTYPDGTEVVDVAMWNELGTSRSPSRPFLRNSIDNHTDDIEKFLQREANAFVNGSSTEEVLKQIGVYMKGVVQKEIKDGEYVPNAESTIKAKGSSKPLIDTGLMRQGVQYVIRQKGEGQ